MSDDIAFQTYVTRTEVCRVPHVRLLLITNAIRSIYRAGCTIGAITFRRSLVPAGRVLSQTPLAGTVLPYQVGGRLVVSRGPF